MLTVHEVSERTGVSIRTLHHYDRIGLLHPAAVTEAGYRLYDDASLERLQCILLFRELEFPLKEIRDILESPVFDRGRALEQQITLLTMRKERLERLIALAHETMDRVYGEPPSCADTKKEKQNGGIQLDFTAFDTKKSDEYAARAKQSWGNTAAYKEFEKKSAGRTGEEEKQLGIGLMEIIAAFGKMKDHDPAGDAAQAQVKRLQDYITAHYYTCTDEILASLGSMYAAGGSMTENINRAGGEGTAEYAANAIKLYCL